MHHTLETLQKSIEDSIRVEHVRMLSKLDGAPKEDLMETARVLGRVESRLMDKVTSQLSQIDDLVKSLTEESDRFREEAESNYAEIEKRTEYARRKHDEAVNWRNEYRKVLIRMEENGRRLERNIRRLEIERNDAEKKFSHWFDAHVKLKKDFDKATEALDENYRKVDRLRREILQYQELLYEDLMRGDEIWPDIPPKEEPLPPPTPEQYLRNEYFRKSMSSLLATMSERYGRIIRLRTGFGLDREYSLDEAAKEFSVSRARAQTVEAQAFSVLRQRGRLDKSIDYFFGDFLPSLEYYAAPHLRARCRRNKSDEKEEEQVKKTKGTKKVKAKKAGRKKAEPKKEEAKIGETGRRVVDPDSLEQRTMSKLREMLGPKKMRVPLREFTERTGFQISSGQYARCQKKVQIEKGIYKLEAKFQW